MTPTRLYQDQAYSILQMAERLPPGARLEAARRNDGTWYVTLGDGHEYQGSTLTDALGQLTTVLALEGAA